jgi:hypothetical protein
MATGTIIAESIRSGATLSGVSVTVHEIERVAPTNISSEQRKAGVPSHWTLLRFEVSEADVERLADALAAVLDGFGWYVDFHTAQETFVVFAGRVFRYAAGDRAGRSAVETYAREHGVPDAQIDWP